MVKVELAYNQGFPWHTRDGCHVRGYILSGTNEFLNGNSLVDWAARIYTLTLGKIVLRTADVVVLSATAYVEDAVRLGVSPTKIKVIPRGVDVQVYHPNPQQREAFRKKLGLKFNEIMVLFAGRLVLVKGLRYFVEAAKALLEEGRKFKLVRILENLPAIVGQDLVTYGPFKREDVILIPYDNAKILIAKKLATEIHSHMDA